MKPLEKPTPIPLVFKTREDLITCLDQHQLSWEHWKLKTIDDLWRGVMSKSFTLFIENDRLVKTKDLVIVDVWYTHGSSRLHLIEDMRSFSNGYSFPVGNTGIRCVRNGKEVLLETAYRAVRSDLRIKKKQSFPIISLCDKPRREEEQSRYFGGILSRTNMYFFFCELPADCYTSSGYEKIEENRRVSYSWVGKR